MCSSCEVATKNRFRSCLTTNCLGARLEESQNCSRENCSKSNFFEYYYSVVAFTVGNWAEWIGKCTCGGDANATRVRTRPCLGTLCHKNETRMELQPCTPCDGSVAAWGRWEQCDCTLSTQTRYRNNCTSTSGCEQDNRSCLIKCGNYSTFSSNIYIIIIGVFDEWTPCSVTCMTGLRTRQRNCSNGNGCPPPPPAIETQACSMGDCRQSTNLAFLSRITSVFRVVCLESVWTM